MVPESVYTYDVFLSFFLKSVKWEPFSADWLQTQNLKTRRVQVPK